jgi:hypothetical protein
MPLVRRHLLNLLTALSLLLFVAVCVLWFGVSGRVYVGSNPQYRFGSDDRGNLEVCRMGGGCARVPYWALFVATGLAPAVRFDAARKKRHLPRRNWPLRSLVFSIFGLYFGWMGWISSGHPDFADARPLIQLWLLVMGATAVVSLGFMLRRSYLAGETELRRRQGRCPACGYDLAANVSGVCPECGAPAGTPSA